MRKIYCINYDLNNPGQNYEKLIAEIKSCGDWCEIMKSSWLICTSLSASAIYNNLKKSLDSNDYILISHLDSDYYGYLKKGIWTWITSYQE